MRLMSPWAGHGALAARDNNRRASPERAPHLRQPRFSTTCAAKGPDRIRTLRRPPVGSRPFRCMDFVVDLDPPHRVLRTTVTTAVTDESFKEIYRSGARLAATGGRYASIVDLSQVVDFPVSADNIRAFA